MFPLCQMLSNRDPYEAGMLSSCISIMADFRILGLNCEQIRLLGRPLPTPDAYTCSTESREVQNPGGDLQCQDAFTSAHMITVLLVQTHDTKP